MRTIDDYLTGDARFPINGSEGMLIKSMGVVMRAADLGQDKDLEITTLRAYPWRSHPYFQIFEGEWPSSLSRTNEVSKYRERMSSGTYHAGIEQSLTPSGGEPYLLILL